MATECQECGRLTLVPAKVTVRKDTDRGSFTIMIPGFVCSADGAEYLTPESQDVVDAWSTSIDEQKQPLTA